MKSNNEILVVDDDLDVLEQTKLVLESAGLVVRCAQGERDAEDEMLKGEPALALVDLMMERTDSGFVLCHRLKTLYPELPVIVMTAVNSATGIRFDPSQGRGRSWIKADLFLDKPVPAEKLVSEVKRLLRAD